MCDREAITLVRPVRSTYMAHSSGYCQLPDPNYSEIVSNYPPTNKTKPTQEELDFQENKKHYTKHLIFHKDTITTITASVMTRGSKLIASQVVKSKKTIKVEYDLYSHNIIDNNKTYAHDYVPNCNKRDCFPTLYIDKQVKPSRTYQFNP